MALLSIFRLNNEPGGLGLSCGPDSLALAGAPLLRRTPTGIAPRSAKELALLLAAAYGREYEEVPRLLTALGVVAVALNAGDLAKAMTTAVMLQLPELDWNGAVRLANAEAVLRKYDPTELRDWHGRWTDSSSEDSSSSELEEAAYQGHYHDEVVKRLASYWRSKGVTVATSVKLVALNGAWCRADLITQPTVGGPLILVEVKTGTRPSYTGPQRLVYPMAEIGNHVFSPENKIRVFGFDPGESLPAMIFLRIYKKDDKSDYFW